MCVVEVHVCGGGVWWRCVVEVCGACVWWRCVVEVCGGGGVHVQYKVHMFRCKIYIHVSIM